MQGGRGQVLRRVFFFVLSSDRTTTEQNTFKEPASQPATQHCGFIGIVGSSGCGAGEGGW